MEFASSSSRFSDEEVSQREIPFMTTVAAMADDTGAAAAATSSSPPSAAVSASASGSAAALRSTDGGGSDDVEVIEKEHMFDKALMPSDVGILNRLVIPKQHAEKYFPLEDAEQKGVILCLEDPAGKLWRFRYSYWNSSQSYVMTKGWSRFVREKRLDAGDTATVTVSFCRGTGGAARDRLFIDWKRASRDPNGMPRLPLPMAPVASPYVLGPWGGGSGGFFMPRAPVYEHHRFSQQEALDFHNINAAATTSTPSLVVQTSQGLYTKTVHEDSRYMELNILECIVNESEEPSHLDFALLHSITENFSEKKKIGNGGCGIVYKGILRNGVVAVKRLHSSRTIKDKMFHREVISLISVKHPNIVRFLGYCSFTEEHAISLGRTTIMADIRERLLCFEYIRNGSLDQHLSDELRGLEWQTRYQIIIGICRGLHYLHSDKEIIHMDLKPGNILLDDLMVPKITDFGLSRPESDIVATTTRLISQGYTAPEYISGDKATSKSDIYSLGVIIIELVTGSRTKPNITKAIRRWNHRWIKSMKQSSLASQQVKTCLDLALRCTQDDPTNRPDISDIIDEVKEIDTTDGQTQVQIRPCCLEDILGIEPLEIHIPFEDFDVSHSIELTNDTDDYIAFVTKPKHRYCTEPDRGVVSPRSKFSVTLAMQAQVKAVPNKHYTEVITVLSTRVDNGAHGAMDITAGDIFIDSEEGNVVDEMNVMVVVGKPELPQE